MKKYVHPEMEIDVFGMNDGILTQGSNGTSTTSLNAGLAFFCLTDLGSISICTSDAPISDPAIDPVDDPAIDPVIEPTPEPMTYVGGGFITHSGSGDSE